MANTMKIVLCGGGTAGHITPNLALADELIGEKIYYVGSDGMEQKLVAPYVESGKIEEFCQISASKFARKLSASNLLLPFKLAKSVRQSKQILKRIQPDVVFGKGGYVCLPVIIAARKLKIPTVIHESDRTVGLANKIAAHFSTRFLSAFPCKQKTEVVGGIVRRSAVTGSKKAGLETMGFDGKKPILLVTGGSLGAKALNDAVINSPELAKKFDVFVISGKGKKIDCDFVRQAEFVSNIGDVFAACDVCLTRAGSNALAELTIAGVPFVAVPLTKASRGEQVNNAKWFAERGCGIYADETELPQKLTKLVSAAYDNRAAFAAKQKSVTAELDGTKKVANVLRSFATVK